MSGLLYEIKKILLCQKGLFCIVLVPLLSAVWLMISDNPCHSAMEQYRSEYEWYLKKVNGYCTDEKARYLEQEAKKITESRKVLERQNGFEVIYQQYLYICENKENRCFLQTNGWTGLLGGGTLNFILFLGILLFVTPVFCSEYNCQMDALILTSKDGRKSSLYKLLIIMAGVLLMCAGVSLMEYGFYSIKYGLPDGDYPIQSIRYFADSSKSITLFEGYVCISLLRLFGGVFFAILLTLLSVLAKKYALTLLAGAAAVLIPYIGLSKTSVYRLPLPLAFLLGTDFFIGDIVSRDALTGDKKIIFTEVDMVTLLALILVSVLLCVLAVVWILRCHSNKWQIKIFAVMLSLVLIMTGCSGRKESQRFVYDSLADDTCMEYEIIKEEETFDYYIKNASTGEIFDLVRSPVFGVFSDEEKVRCYYLRSPYLYYTMLATESYVNRVGSYNSNITKAAVVEPNLDTLEEKIIFEQITNSGRSLFGIDYETGDKWKFLEFHYAFFLDGDSIFLLETTA